MSPVNKKLFIIKPMKDPDSVERKRSERIEKDYIKPAAEREGYESYDDIQAYGLTIAQEIFKGLEGDPMVIAYLGYPPWNENVMFEVGYRLATSKPLVILRHSDTTLPFDLQDQKCVTLPPYDQLETKGFDLRLMSWGDGSGAPTSGRNLIVVGTDNNGLLHIRIFDAAGNRIKDTDETQLPAQAAAIATLKQRLPGLLPPHVLTDAEKAQVIAEATSIVDQTQTKDGSHNEGIVEEIARAIHNRRGLTRLNSAYAVAEILIDQRDLADEKCRETIFTASSEAADQIFHMKDSLVGKTFTEIENSLSPRLEKCQRRPFFEGYYALIARLMVGQGQDLKDIRATVPFIFNNASIVDPDSPEYVDPELRGRAFLAIIVQHRKLPNALSLRMLYVGDVKGALKREAGHYVCDLPRVRRLIIETIQKMMSERKRSRR